MRMCLAPRRKRRGWTLIEVLVVFAILGILVGLSVTVITRIRERANQLTCQSNLRDLGLAVHAHHNTKRTMPPYASGRKNEIHGGWFIHLMPYVGQDAVYDRLVNGQRVSNHGLRLMTDGRYLPGVRGVTYPLLICRSDPSSRANSQDSTTNYLANWYAFTDEVPGMYRPAQRFDQLQDGLSNVVLFAEGYSNCDSLIRMALFSAHYHNFGITQEGLPSDDNWYAPKNYVLFQNKPAHCDKWRAQSPHQYMPIAVADGSVRKINSNISLLTWTYALKPRDGNVLGDDW